MMNFLYLNFIIVLWLTALTPLLLGLLVLFKNRKSIINRTFALYSFSISWWSFSEIWGIACDKRLTALVWTRIEQIGVFFIPTFFIHFVVSLLNIKNKRWLLKLCYVFSSVFALLSLTPLMIADSVPKPNIAYVKRFATPGIAYHFAILFFIAIVVYGLIKLYSAYSSSRGAKRNQLKYLFWGTLFGYFGGSANFLLVYDISMPIWNPFGTYALPIYIAAVAYAIIKYRLLDIRVAITRAGLFAIIYSFVLGLPFCVGYIAKAWVLPTITMFILATLGPLIYTHLRKKAEDIFLVEQKRYQRALLAASEGMTAIKELDRLIPLIARIMRKYIGVTHAYVYLQDPEVGGYKLQQKKRNKDGQAVKQDKEVVLYKSLLVKHLQQNKDIVLYDELKFLGDNTFLAEEMEKIEANIIIPCSVTDELLGFLVMGKKKSDNAYTTDDLRVFMTLSNQAAIAIENAIYFSESRKTLAEQFHEYRLRSLGQMGSHMGHQVGNRFGAIMGNAEKALILRLKKIDKSKLSNKEKIFLDETIDFLSKIINDAQLGGDMCKRLTSFSKKDISLNAIDLNEALQAVLQLLTCKFDVEELNLKIDIEKTNLRIKGDMNLLQNVLLNLLDNAHDAQRARRDDERYNKNYISETQIKAILRNNLWCIELSDNGIGMTDEQLDRLFLPFFTTKASTGKGTGIGLSIIKKMIDELGGTINAKSTVGKGTTFYVTLPSIGANKKTKEKNQ